MHDTNSSSPALNLFTFLLLLFTAGVDESHLITVYEFIMKHTFSGAYKKQQLHGFGIACDVLYAVCN